MSQKENSVETLILAGHPGKLAKVIDGHWNTHSNESPSALPIVLKIAESIAPDNLIAQLQKSRTVEHLIQISSNDPSGDIVFKTVAERISKSIFQYLGEVTRVEVLLADFKGNLIGQAVTND